MARPDDPTSTAGGADAPEPWGAQAGRRSGRGDRPSSGVASVAIVVERPGRPLAIAVDQLLCEQEMVLKPFEPWVPLPPYLSGCTILASGEVVPVLKPEALSPPASLDLNRETTVTSLLPTALVVDDSLTVRRWMVRSLEREGYQVVQCRDGQEAWERLAAGLRCNLVVSDVEMPRLDGFSS
ncbi:MAG: response regulator [Synechococcales cyanobacterium CRU_2_2]|nr:response regulator [Synechococcales cyanobacterium CRU_2_2]